MDIPARQGRYGQIPARIPPIQRLCRAIWHVGQRLGCKERKAPGAGDEAKTPI